jgi:hypothetical protein
MSLFAKKIKVRVLVSGRIGPGWRSCDQTFSLPVGATLSALLDAAERGGIDLRRAIDESPHLRHTLMLNGERCPLDDNQARVLADGDELYLLGPIAGG